MAKKQHMTPEEGYFLWLCDKVREEGYDRLFDALHSFEFSEETAKFVGNDYNRVEDGRELRYLYFLESGQSPLEEVPEGTCSVFEMMIALARKMKMNLDAHTVYYWFWELARNIELEDFTDEVLEDPKRRVELKHIIDNVLRRRVVKGRFYTFFPIKNVTKNVTKVSQCYKNDLEIWYQMSQYLIENYM